MTDTEPTTTQLHHRGTCSRPPSASWAIPGAVRTTCPECGRFTVTWDAPRYPTRDPQIQGESNFHPAAEVVAPPSNYRCATHLDEAISWRGGRCRLCPPPTPKIRKAKRPSDQTERY